MAEEAEAPWDAQTDAFVDELEPLINDSYKISIRKLLLTPQVYLNEEGIADKLNGIRKIAEDYFSGLEALFADEEEEMEKQLEAIDSAYNQINQSITSKSSIARVPFIKPLDITFGSAQPETIFIDKADSQIDALVTKLINTSDYIFNISATYRKYMIGIWLFSGKKDIILSFKMPENPIIAIENARDIINNHIDSFENTLPKKEEE